MSSSSTVPSRPWATCFALGAAGLTACSGCGDSGASKPPGGDEPEALRAAIVDYAFRSGAFPTAPPDAVEEDVSNELFVDVPNLARIDVMRFDLDFGLWSRVYEFWPESSNGQLVLYHVGHWHTLSGGDHVVKWLVERGYTVMFMFMPLFGDNPANVDVEFEGETYRLGKRHEDFGPIEERGGNVFHLFFEPVARAVTHAVERQGFEQIAMVGLSGGGWTTDIYSSIDPRVGTSFTIQGSIPFHLRTRRSDLGEYEQLRDHPFYEIATFMDFYFLAARGPGQRHIQISHRDDECCYEWRGREEAFRAYEREIVERLERDPAGGHYRLELLPGLREHNTHGPDLEIIDREMRALR